VKILNVKELTTTLFDVNTENFDRIAFEIFEFQYHQVAIYRSYCDSLKRNPTNVLKLLDIPFLPVQFFKSHKIIAATKTTVKIFESSTTTSSTPARHFVADLKLYEQSFRKSFELFYGNIADYAILALLPSYMERGTSSLLMMANDFIKSSKYKESSFVLDDFENLRDKLMALKKKNAKVLLLGVTYALLDFAEQFSIEIPNTIIMETGGMKGKRTEITREEVHTILKKTFSVENIHSEYGMTELLSQAYSQGNGIFNTPPWMKIILRDIYDPLNPSYNNKTGALNVIDFANYNSCSFIATNDLGGMNDNGGFEILGRMDNAEMRGCNLMYV